MQTAFHRPRVATWLAVVSLLGASTAHADPGLKFEGEAWIPALAVISSPHDESGSAADPELEGNLQSLAIGGLGSSEPDVDSSRIAGDSRTVRAMLLISPAVEPADAPEGGSAVEPGSGAETALLAAGPGGTPPRGLLVAPVEVLAPSVSTGGSNTEQVDEIERWVPGFAVYSGALVEVADAAVESGPVSESLFSHPGDTECTVPGGEGETFTSNLIRCPDAGDWRMVTPSVGLSVEVMTPGVTALPGSPRLFVHGGAELALSSEYDIAKEGTLGEFSFLDDEKPLEKRRRRPLEGTVGGQGSVTAVNVEPLVVKGGAGVAFTVDALDRRFRIKPSIEYKREEIKAEGEIARAVSLFADSLIFPQAQVEAQRPRELRLKGSQKKVYHGFGPGLEVEMDAARAGPFMMTVFIGAKAYRFIGNRKLEFTTTNDRGESATWEFEKHRWAYEGGMGVRFRLHPE
jgi:hypothetical protein